MNHICLLKNGPDVLRVVKSEEALKVPFWIQNRIFIGEGDLTTKTPIILIGAAKEANILLGPA